VEGRLRKLPEAYRIGVIRAAQGRLRVSGHIWRQICYRSRYGPLKARTLTLPVPHSHAFSLRSPLSALQPPPLPALPGDEHSQGTPSLPAQRNGGPVSCLYSDLIWPYSDILTEFDFVWKKITICFPSLVPCVVKSRFTAKSQFSFRVLHLSSML
jgi:hypothetical protein